MLNLFYLLLILRVGSTDELIFEMETVGVGEDVTLTCTRQKSEFEATLFWIRLVSKNLKPEFLGGTFAFDYEDVKQNSHITAKQGNATYVLHISKTKLSDTGVYYCMKVDQLNMTFLKRTFLTIKGQEPNITAVIQVPPSDPVHPGDSVTLQCSVLSDSETKTCPGDHGVYWFRAGSDQSHPSVIYVHGNWSDGCEKSPETRTPQKCVYNFFKDNVSSSDAGTYHCAVATCGEILFSNGTKLNVEALDMWDLQKANTVVCLLCAALAISLIVISFLIYTMKRKSYDCSNAAVVLETNAAAASGDHHSRQRDKDLLAYSAPTFTKRKVGKERRNVKTAEGETAYADVRAVVVD